MTPQELSNRMAEAAKEFKPATELLRAVGRVAHTAIRSQIRARAYRTGRLHGSGVERVVGDRVSVEFTAPYAKSVNDGTKYMEGRHYMEHGLTDAMPDIDREMKQWGEMVLGKVAGR